MKKIFRTITDRWKASIPVFFKWVMGIGSGVAAVALAIHMALTSGGATIPQWWDTIYPYLIGVGAGMIATAKLTQKQQDTSIINKEEDDPVQSQERTEHL